MPSSLIYIQFQPARSPPLFALYLMPKDEFEEKYTDIFAMDQTLIISSSATNILGTNDYTLEIYLPSCKVFILDGKEHINSYKMLCLTKFHGNLDLLKAIDSQRGSIIYQNQQKHLGLSPHRDELSDSTE